MAQRKSGIVDPDFQAAVALIEDELNAEQTKKASTSTGKKTADKGANEQLAQVQDESDLKDQTIEHLKQRVSNLQANSSPDGLPPPQVPPLTSASAASPAGKSKKAGVRKQQR